MIHDEIPEKKKVPTGWDGRKKRTKFYLKMIRDRAKALRREASVIQRSVNNPNISAGEATECRRKAMDALRAAAAVLDQRADAWEMAIAIEKGS